MPAPPPEAVEPVRAGGPGGGCGAGATPTASRLMGALRVASKPGVRCSFGMGDSTLGLKAGTCVGTASAFCNISAAREVTKPTEGRLLGGGFAMGVLGPWTDCAGRDC